MIKLKTPALLFQKGREFIPCYHLYSQATCVTCLTEYGRSDTLAPVTVCFPSQPTWLILSVRNSKMYSHFLFMSLSSTGIFLYEIKMLLFLFIVFIIMSERYSICIIIFIMGNLIYSNFLFILPPSRRFVNHCN